MEDQSPTHLLVKTGMEWNVLQVGVEDVIQTLEDILPDEPDDERHIIEARLEAAKALKERLDRPFSGETAAQTES